MTNSKTNDADNPFLKLGALFVHCPVAEFAKKHGADYLVVKINDECLNTKKQDDELVAAGYTLNKEFKFGDKLYSGDICILVKIHTYDVPNDTIYFMFQDQILGVNREYWENNFQPLTAVRLREK